MVFGARRKDRLEKVEAFKGWVCSMLIDAHIISIVYTVKTRVLFREKPWYPNLLE
jgi:hypothetical protein